MIGLVYSRQPVGNIGLRQAIAPDFPDPGHPAGHEAKPASGTPICAGMLRSGGLCILDHRPIEIVGRAVQVDHGTRRMGDKRGRTR